MYEKEEQERFLAKKIEELNKILSKNNVIELMEVLSNTKKMLIKNFISGLAKGIGIGIGVTIITAVIIVFLQRLVRLNIPIIGEYITDIVEIVEKNK